jgi:quinol monooxygenase YgiN
MIIVNAKIFAKENMADKVVETAQPLIKGTRAEAGCIEYNFYNAVEDKNLLLVAEKWESIDALKAHLEMPHFVQFGEDVGDLLAADLEIAVYSAEEVDL